MEEKELAAMKEGAEEMRQDISTAEQHGWSMASLRTKSARAALRYVEHLESVGARPSAEDSPSSPSVSGTVDTPELSELVIQIKKYPMLSGPMNDLIAHIEQDKAQAVRAAREEAAIVGWNDALAEAASMVEDYQADRADGVTYTEIALAIRKLRTPQAAGTEQEKNQ